jgi:hypothetical protein
VPDVRAALGGREMKLHIVSDGMTPAHRVSLLDENGNELKGLRATRLTINWAEADVPRCELEAIAPAIDVWCEGKITRVRLPNGQVCRVVED